MDKMIYCQKDIPKDRLRYGLRASAATGCGWVAVYNALRLMGYSPKAERVIEFFEKQIPVINGNMGTFKYSPALFFRKMGFSVKVSHRKSRFDAIAKDSDAVIVYFWWRKKLRIGAHFVAVHHTARGFVGYNTYSNSKRADSWGDSIEKFLDDKKYFMCFITGVKKKDSTTHTDGRS